MELEETMMLIILLHLLPQQRFVYVIAIDTYCDNTNNHTFNNLFLFDGYNVPSYNVPSHHGFV